MGIFTCLHFVYEFLSDFLKILLHVCQWNNLWNFRESYTANNCLELIWSSSSVVFQARPILWWQKYAPHKKEDELLYHSMPMLGREICKGDLCNFSALLIHHSNYCFAVALKIAVASYSPLFIFNDSVLSFLR